MLSQRLLIHATCYEYVHKILLIITFLAYSNFANSQGSITGPSEVCKNATATYTVSGSSATYGYTWTNPSGGITILSGQNTNQITATFPNAANGLILQVTGNGLNASKTISWVRLPVTEAGTISGPSTVCAGQNNVQFTVSQIENATNYSWTAPNPANVTPGTPTSSNSVKIDFPTFYTGSSTMYVYGYSNCSSGPSSSKAIQIVNLLPGTPGSISGSAAVAPGSTGNPYSVTPVANASSYEWSMPAGASIASGAGTTSITVNYSTSFAGGSISVKGVNSTCSGPSSSPLNIGLSTLPGAAGTISGDNPCVGSTDVYVWYSVSPILNVGTYGYEWSFGAPITPVTDTRLNSVQVKFPANWTGNSATISVKGHNVYGSGAPSSRTIVIYHPGGSAGPISGKSEICNNETNLVYSIAPVPGANGYSWSLPPNTISQQSGNSITVTFPTSFTSGTISVSAQNGSCGGGQPSSLFITSSNPGNVGENRSSHSVDLVTGALSVSIDLFTVSDGEASVPGLLHYNGSGVQVTSDEGFTGQNWNLSANTYMISRDVRGLPDDHYVDNSLDMRRGWLHSTTRNEIKDKTFDTDNDPSTCADEYNNYTFLNGIDYTKDTEPDAFHLSAPGLSFDFYFDETGTPRVVPYQDVKITRSVSSPKILSFTVTDARGFQYTFSEIEQVTETLYAPNDFYQVRKSHLYQQPITYTTAWRLTHIVAPVYGLITFHYRSVNTSDAAFYPLYVQRLRAYKYRYPVTFKNSDGVLSQLEFGRTSIIKVLDSIASPVTKVVFESAPRSITSVLPRLNAIKVYDKRNGTTVFKREFLLNYSTVDRGNLTSVTERYACITQQYTLEYYPGYLPPYQSSDSDDWNFYSNNVGTYTESFTTGVLKRVIHPGKGYTAFFYEPHEYDDGTVTGLIAGMRIRKVIGYSGVPYNDFVREYEYKAINGRPSGRLQGKGTSRFTVAILGPNIGGWNKYKRWATLFNQPNLHNLFTIKASDQLASPEMVNGSVVAYERVTVKTSGAGYSIYEYDLPSSFGNASANNNEWQTSKVFLARTSTGTSECYESPDIDASDGSYHYPFPPNPNYDFAKGLLKKVTDYHANGNKVRDVVYNYQRIYAPGLSGIRKIYGLALEELPTSYFNNNWYYEGKMFLYSKYEIFTDVGTVVSSETETIYHTPDLVKKTETTTDYAYVSPHHRQLSSIVRHNSDGTQTITRHKYVDDFAVSHSGNPMSQALAALKTANRKLLVESAISKVIGGSEEYTSASVMIFQMLAGKVYPYKQYTFASPEGTTSFTMASADGTNFSFNEANYLINQTFLSFDNYGNPTEVQDRSRNISGVLYDYKGSLPAFAVSRARLAETRYTSFERSSAFGFTTNSTAGYGGGHTGNRSVYLPGGNSTYISCNGVSKENGTSSFTFSIWITAFSNANLTLQFDNGSVFKTIDLPYFTTNPVTGYTWKYHTVTIDATDFPATFNLKIFPSTSILVDDLVLCPSHAEVISFGYNMLNQKVNESDSRGVSVFYEYDGWGRLNAVYDTNRNMVKKYDYQTRP